MRRYLSALSALLLVLVLSPGTGAATEHDDSAGGPVILMGLDSELGAGWSDHGPPEDHAAMVQSLLDAVSNGGEGILVFGDESVSRIRTYWESDVGSNVGEDVTFVSGADDILEQDLDGFAMIGVASSRFQVTGGLTEAENQALISRDIEIAEFVNDGGGLLGKTQYGLDDPFGYVGPLGEFEAIAPPQFSSIEVTQAGLDLGLTQSGMDGWCCYHEVFEAFPDFMEVLITHDAGGTHQGKAAAIGGVDVTIPTGIELEPTSASLDVGETHTVTALVEENEGPAEDVEVTFSVIDGPHEGTSHVGSTDGDGIATFSYEGTEPGTDSIRASFVDSFERTRNSNTVTAEWTEVAGDPVPVCQPPAAFDIGDGDFDDVDGEGEHHFNIECIARYGIALGYPDGTYLPGQDVSRAQMASFIADFVRTSGTEVGPVAGADRFVDIAGTFPRHRDNINALADGEIALGSDGNRYRPAESITRQQMAGLIADALDVAHNGSVDGSVWDGVDHDGAGHDDTGAIADDRLRTSIEKLTAVGVVVGYDDGTYRPTEDVTRAQMASYIIRAAEYLDGLGEWLPTS